MLLTPGVGKMNSSLESDHWVYIMECQWLLISCFHTPANLSYCRTAYVGQTYVRKTLWEDQLPTFVAGIEKIPRKHQLVKKIWRVMGNSVSAGSL